MKKQKENIWKDRPALVFACSGASNVGEIADLAARRLFRDGSVVMSCPSAVSGRIKSQIERIQKASQVIVLDGCEKDCVHRTLINAGFGSYAHIRLNDLGLIKGGARVDEEAVDKVVRHTKCILKTSSLWRDVFSFRYDPSKADRLASE
ncbi:MAG: zinc-binding protein [candidate division Zixibacteria bacterium]|nr:zinc-binding protein [candidate division Zixibacteria bacterium]